MSMQPRPWPEPAPEIVVAVRAMYRNRELPVPVVVRDRLGELFADDEFAAAFGVRGRPGWSPGRLALVTVLQQAENLTDRAAADAVREKLSWKYALGLSLDDPGFDASILSEFRSRVIAGGLEQRVLDALLEKLTGLGLLGPGGKQRSDSTHVVSAVRDLNRLELAGESVRAALEALAAAAPDWLGAALEVAEWSTRYQQRVDSWRLPTSQPKRDELALAYGRDGYALLAAVYASGAPDWLAQIPAVDVLRVVLLQNYTRSIDASGREVITRREAKTDGLPPGSIRLASPYDLDARWSCKRDSYWCGYAVHVSETCTRPEDAPAHAAPNLITNVATTHAAVSDARMVEPIHDELSRRNLLPDEHYADSGYSSATAIEHARRDFGIELITPARVDASRQAQAGAGYDRAAFTIDFDAEQATCPQGQLSSHWHEAIQRDQPAVVIRFTAATCGPCPVREQCTTSARGRSLTIRRDGTFQTRNDALSEQETKAWQEKYALRAGIEGTIRQGLAVTELRQARYRGLAKTRFEHLCAATALNLIRLNNWWNGHPLDRSRHSHLTRLDHDLAA